MVVFLHIGYRGGRYITTKGLLRSTQQGNPLLWTKASKGADVPYTRNNPNAPEVSKSHP